MALLKHLVYPSVNAVRLTDYNLLLRKIPTSERRTMMAKALSFQPAVLARLCVRPDSDIDKIAAYWGGMNNVHFTDVRPMLEALKGLPHGGTVSLMYFLPPFARARLYTYPLPSQPGDPEGLPLEHVQFLKPPTRIAIMIHNSRLIIFKIIFTGLMLHLFTATSCYMRMAKAKSNIPPFISPTTWLSPIWQQLPTAVDDRSHGRHADDVSHFKANVLSPENRVNGFSPTNYALNQSVRKLILPSISPDCMFHVQ